MRKYLAKKNKPAFYVPFEVHTICPKITLNKCCFHEDQRV